MHIRIKPDAIIGIRFNAQITSASVTIFVRARYREHLRAHAQDEAFCLCQVRTQCFFAKRIKFF